MVKGLLLLCLMLINVVRPQPLCSDDGTIQSYQCDSTDGLAICFRAPIPPAEIGCRAFDIQPRQTRRFFVDDVSEDADTCIYSVRLQTAVVGCTCYNVTIGEYTTTHCCDEMGRQCTIVTPGTDGSDEPSVTPGTDGSDEPSVTSDFNGTVRPDSTKWELWWITLPSGIVLVVGLLIALLIGWLKNVFRGLSHLSRFINHVYGDGGGDGNCDRQFSDIEEGRASCSTAADQATSQETTSAAHSTGLASYTQQSSIVRLRRGSGSRTTRDDNFVAVAVEDIIVRTQVNATEAGDIRSIGIFEGSGMTSNAMVETTDRSKCGSQCVASPILNHEESARRKSMLVI